MSKRKFYISTSGNDTNDGLSVATPWKTLKKVSGQVFEPGDAVLLKTGEFWDEAVEIQGHGSAQDPILFSSYGGSEKPIIRYGIGDVVKAVNPNHLIIRGLHIQCTTELPLFSEAEYRNHDRQQGKYRLNRGIFLEFDNSMRCSGIVIADNTVAGPGVDSFSEGINALVRYPSTPGSLRESVVTDLHFLGNEVHGFGWIGLTTTGASTGEQGRQWFPQFLFSGVRMFNNLVHDIGVQGLLLCHGKDSLMKWNIVHHAGMYKGPGVKWSPAGLWVWSSRNVDLMFNEVYEMQDSDSGHDATGYDIDWHSEEIRIKYNHAHDNYGNGIVTMACRNSEISGNRVEGNRCLLNCGKGQIGLTNWHQDQSEDSITNVENLSMIDNLIIIDREDTGALNSLKTAPGPDWKGNTFSGNRVVLKKEIKPSFLYDIKPEAAVDQIGNNLFYGFPEAFHQQGTETDRFVEIEDHSPVKIRNLSAKYNARTGKVILSWDIDERTRKYVHHFNIHRSLTPHFKPEYRNMVGQEKGSTFTDDFEKDERSLYYLVQAEDMVGGYGPTAEIEVWAEA